VIPGSWRGAGCVFFFGGCGGWGGVVWEGFARLVAVPLTEESAFEGPCETMSAEDVSFLLSVPPVMGSSKNPKNAPSLYHKGEETPPPNRRRWQCARGFFLLEDFFSPPGYRSASEKMGRFLSPSISG